MPLRRSVLSTIVIALALGVVAPKARAADPPISKERQLEICIASFEEAQLKRKRGKLVFAHKLFTDCSTQVCPKPLRDDCAVRRDETDKAIPSVTFVVRDAANKDVDGATLKIDGAPFEGAPGLATPIDPGTHEIEIVVGTAAPQKTKVTIAEGEKSRVVVLEYKSATTVAKQLSSNAPPAAPPSESSIPVGPIVTAGVGVLVLLAATGFWFLADGEEDKRVENYALARTKPAAEAEALRQSAASHQDAAENNRRLAYIGGVSALVVLGVAVAWYFIDRSSKSNAPPMAAWQRLQPHVGSASWSMTF